MQKQIAHYENKLNYEIDAWDLSLLLAKQAEIYIVDCRSDKAYAQEHIPTAIHLPHRDISMQTTASLDRSYLIITYCDGIGCNASTKGALAMAKLGFRVKELMGGLDWWKRDGHGTEGRFPQKDTPFCGC